MYPPRIGQSQVLTAVLLAGIILTAITSAFLWGMPLLQKNQDQTQVENTLQDFRKLSSGIESVITEGGSRQVTVRLGNGALEIDDADNMFTYQTATRGVYVSTENWVPLNENSLLGINRTTGEREPDRYGIRGAHKFGVLIGRATDAGNDYLTRYRLVYRYLKDPDTRQTYTVDLVPVGQDTVSGGGEHTVTFRQGDRTTVPGAGINGGTLHRIEVLAEVT
jgi:hypothetical protein